MVAFDKHFASVESVEDAEKPTIYDNITKVVNTVVWTNPFVVAGNHDIFKLDDYAAYFDDIRGYHVLNGIIFSHVPVHPESLARFGCNVHGHLHANRVRRPSKIDRLGTSPCVEYGDEIDPNYYNVSVECTDFAPITLEDLYERIQAQGGHVGFKNGNGAQGVD